MKGLRGLSAGAISVALCFAQAAPAGADVIFLDPDSDGVVESNGSVAQVIGSLVCSADQVGLSYRVIAKVKQGNTKLVATTGKGVCTGGSDSFEVTAFLQQGPGLVAGAATLTLNAQTGIPNVAISDTSGVTESVTVVIV